MSLRSWSWVVLLLAASAQATTLTLPPAKDNTLYESANGTLSNGSGQFLFSGETNEGSSRRALLKFDLSSLPTNAQFTRVILTLTVSKTVSGGQTHTLHRMLADWGEGTSNAGDPGGQGTNAATGDATWQHTFFSNTLWTTPGGDYTSTISASQTVARNGAYTWESAQMLADVRAWVDTPSANFGWILLGGEAGNRTAKRFYSREAGSASQRPKLTVEYTLPNTLPTLGAVADQNIDEDQTAGPIALILGDTESPSDSLSLRARADNTALLPSSGIALGGSGANRTLTLTPATDSSGSALITLVVSDGTDSTSQTFILTVNPVAETPAINPEVQPLIADFDRDGKVDFSDFFLFADHFGETSASPGWNAAFDLSGNQLVDFADFFLFADHFGEKSTP